MFRSALLNRVGAQMHARTTLSIRSITSATTRDLARIGQGRAPFGLIIRQIQKPQNSRVLARNMSGGKKAAPEEPENAIMVTPYQRVAQASSAGFWLCLGGLACVCGYYIIKELMPTRMNPNSLYSEAADEVMACPELTTLLGSPLKSYGRDHHGRKEGRRNFIEHVEIPDRQTQEPTLRIRFNVEGPYGVAECYASVVKGMSSGEWLYLIVKIRNTGKVMTLHDVRNTRTKNENTGLFGMDNPLAKLLGGGGSD